MKKKVTISCSKIDAIPSFFPSFSHTRTHTQGPNPPLSPEESLHQWPSFHLSSLVCFPPSPSYSDLFLHSNLLSFLVHRSSPPLTCALHRPPRVYLRARSLPVPVSIHMCFRWRSVGGVCQRVLAFILSLSPFLLRNMMDVSKQSETWISVPTTDAAFTSKCVRARVRLCAQRHWRLFDLIVLLERRLLSCFMAGAIGRYAASPASPQPSIIPLSADKRAALILLLPPSPSETFKTLSRRLSLTRAVMYAHILGLPPRFVS